MVGRRRGGARGRSTTASSRWESRQAQVSNLAMGSSQTEIGGLLWLTDRDHRNRNTGTDSYLTSTHGEDNAPTFESKFSMSAQMCKTIRYSGQIFTLCIWGSSCRVRTRVLGRLPIQPLMGRQECQPTSSGISSRYFFCYPTLAGYDNLGTPYFFFFSPSLKLWPIQFKPESPLVTYYSTGMEYRFTVSLFFFFPFLPLDLSLILHPNTRYSIYALQAP